MAVSMSSAKCQEITKHYVSKRMLSLTNYKDCFAHVRKSTYIGLQQWDACANLFLLAVIGQ